ERLLRHISIKPKQTAVIGDWYNDITMFQTKAVKVAVANAIPELLNKADKSLLGLVVPVLAEDHIIIDCIDGVDAEKNRLRTNVSGWLSLTSAEEKATDAKPARRLLKPNKKVMLAACAGHRWQSCQSKKLRPIIPSLRELLLSCSINWQNFHQVLK
ncbi:MAG: HAD hydrolase family protein, partial [Colwellia sp.]|nr:HAD hydrolase family protein [Colwellia sp.]